MRDKISCTPSTDPTGKLGSIGWLREAESGNLPTFPAAEEFKDDFQNVEEAPPGAPPSAPADDAPPPPPAEDPVKSDPALKQWFMMLKVGVPAQAVRNKMSLSGVDEGTIEKVIKIHQG